MSPEAAAARAWLAARGPLPPDSGFDALDGYARDVLEYGRRVNLTAAKDAGELWRRHILDGLAALAPLKARLGGVERPRLVDLGCGAGFVGFALKAAWPEAEVTLVESAYRKASFLTWAAARAGFKGLSALHARAGGTAELELLRASGGSGGRLALAADAVLARALAPLGEALALARALTRPGGWTVVYQSARPQGLEAEAYRLPEESQDRFLVFERRPG